ncbi:MAG: type III pantothenate kinase [Pseudomonadota bacterium]|nr:type III pantothenate kinase [Pseudomonadota bacterium]MDP1902848.1 type III pantothenate kinase [Pseudomonadota bacterium]MDP2352838.1 type III pantothenate kinase [Pseudomonadota bacterium]
MILLLDAGNSRIKWGVRQGGRWLARGVCPTREVARLGADLEPFPCAQALLCCVADGITRSTLDALLAARVEQLVWLSALADAHGVCNRYQPPASLGADRYAALVAARHRELGGCVVVTVGTALTVDALTGAGVFLGGVIAPGPELMRAALLRGTAGVRELSGDVLDFPVDTGAAVSSGIALAQVGVVTGMRARLLRQGRGPVTILLSGGARAVMAGLLEPPVVEADDLVLEGLLWIAREREWDV